MTKTLSLLAACLALASCAIAPVPEAPRLAPAALPMGTQLAQIQLHAVASRVPGEANGYSVQYGWLCEHAPRRLWPAGTVPLSPRDAEEAFATVLQPLGYAVHVPPTSMFAPATDAQYQVGATITAMSAHFCFPFSGSPSLNVGRPDLVKGNVHLQIMWEVFSLSRKEVVFTATTGGTATAAEAAPGGTRRLFLEAFKANLGNLAALPGFQDVSRQEPSPGVRSGNI